MSDRITNLTDNGDLQKFETTDEDGQMCQAYQIVVNETGCQVWGHRYIGNLGDFRLSRNSVKAGHYVTDKQIRDQLPQAVADKAIADFKAARVAAAEVRKATPKGRRAKI